MTVRFKTSGETGTAAGLMAMAGTGYGVAQVLPMVLTCARIVIDDPAPALDRHHAIAIARHASQDDRASLQGPTHPASAGMRPFQPLPASMVSTSFCTRRASSGVASRLGSCRMHSSRSSSCAARLAARGSDGRSASSVNGPPSDLASM